MKDSIKSELVISGFNISPEEVTTRIGLEPTRVVLEGDIKRADPSGANPPVLHKQSVWVIQTDISPDTSFDGHLKQTLEKLRPYGNAIAEIADKYECELSIYGFAENADRIAIHINKDEIKELAQLGIGLDVDIYPTAD
jgi:hypothetical protein